MSAAPTILGVERLSVFYGKVAAAIGLTLSLPTGSIVTVIGPNGAGKTSMIGALMGLIAAEGEIVYLGKAIGDLEVEERVAAGISLVPERRELFGELSVYDNLALGAYCRRRKGDDRIDADLSDVYTRFPRLKERREQQASTLSGGERQMLAMGRALMARPRVLLLDEPSIGLAPLVVREVFSVISQLRETGTTILFAEQNARAALRVADYAYVMESGQFVLEGEASSIANNPAVIEKYLGIRDAMRKPSETES